MSLSLKVSILVSPTLGQRGGLDKKPPRVYLIIKRQCKIYLDVSLKPLSQSGFSHIQLLELYTMSSLMSICDFTLRNVSGHQEKLKP